MDIERFGSTLKLDAYFTRCILLFILTFLLFHAYCLAITPEPVSGKHGRPMLTCVHGLVKSQISGLGLCPGSKSVNERAPVHRRRGSIVGRGKEGGRASECGGER